jgi:branched-chain amino acid transport system ATP-binding protein
LSVLDNLRVAASSLSPAASLVAIDRVLDIFPELKVKLPVLASTLSGGQKQMACIAQALVVPPRVLVVEELSLGLDSTVVKPLAQVLERAAESGVGVLLIEQFTTLALSLATQTYVLERGRIVFAGASAELRDQPAILHNSYLTTSTVA